jgi:hypothetical protein
VRLRGPLPEEAVVPRRVCGLGGPMALVSRACRLQPRRLPLPVAVLRQAGRRVAVHSVALQSRIVVLHRGSLAVLRRALPRVCCRAVIRCSKLQHRRGSLAFLRHALRRVWCRAVILYRKLEHRHGSLVFLRHALRRVWSRAVIRCWKLQLHHESLAVLLRDLLLVWCRAAIRYWALQLHHDRVCCHQDETKVYPQRRDEVSQWCGGRRPGLRAEHPAPEVWMWISTLAGQDSSNWYALRAALPPTAEPSWRLA